MKAQDLLDYAFHQLDDLGRIEFEREMASDPGLFHRVGRLNESLSRLLDNGEEIEPPAGLAAKTIQTVERRKARPHPGDFLPSKSPFRLADFAVAASVFFAATLTLSVPLLRSRAQMDQAACAFNLGKLGVSLASYHSTHGSYPVVPADLPTGAYGSMLHDAHTLQDANILKCPSATDENAANSLPPYEKLRQLSPESYGNMYNGFFAYNLGYRHPDGHAPQIHQSLLERMPVASDGPALSPDGRILDGNSPNHGGRGQNVLFCDGHSEFRRGRWISHRDRDLFLNDAERPAAGLHPEDSALVPSSHPVRLR